MEKKEDIIKGLYERIGQREVKKRVMNFIEKNCIFRSKYVQKHQTDGMGFIPAIGKTEELFIELELVFYDGNH